jgi:protein phosphatase
VLDTAAGVWLDRNGIVTSSRNKPTSEPDPSLELLRRGRHAAASIGSQIFIYGGLKGGNSNCIRNILGCNGFGLLGIYSMG